MKNVQFITRKTNLDCGHRVMNEKMKCFNVHGHTYLTELTFSFENMEDIGYAIDFKELKRVFVEFLQVYFDHGMILNPKDEKLINTTLDLDSKLWLMSLNGVDNYCNPTVENVAKEVFLAMEILSEILYGNSKTGLSIHQVKMFETPNCWTDCYKESITPSERKNFYNVRLNLISQFAEEMGVIDYDDRSTCDSDKVSKENIDKLQDTLDWVKNFPIPGLKDFKGNEPFTFPNIPQEPLKDYMNSCGVCGIQLRGVMGYVCPRGADCPTGLAGPQFNATQTKTDITN